MSEAGGRRRYHFAEFVLDSGRSTLFRGVEELRLRPQSFDVLQFLLERNGEVVSRDELHDAIWADRAVTDDSLAQCVVEIRRALDDPAKKLLRTVPRRGYIFDAEVSVEEQDGSVLVPRRRLVSAQLVALAAVVAIALLVARTVWIDEPAPNSIAVLPFIDISEAQDLKHIGDGLAEDILNTLAYRKDLKVIAQPSSFIYSTQLRDFESIGDALNVAYVLAGNVQRGADGIRVVAQLIDASDSTHVWSERFETSVQDLAPVHEQISRMVWRELRPASSGEDDMDVYAGISASEQMMLARKYELMVREQPEVDHASLARAIELYGDATVANPNSAIAFAGLARVLLFNGELNQAKRAIDTALRKNPDLSDVQEVLARYLWLTAQAGAGEAWKRAAELNPNSADAAGAYGFWLWTQGRYEGANSYLHLAKEKDPGSLSRFADLGNFLGNEARIGEVNALIAEIQNRFDSAESYRVIARLLDLIGRVDESIAWLIRARDKQPDDPSYNWAIAELLVDINDYEAALRLEPDPPLGVLLKMGRYEEFIERAGMASIDDPDDITLQYLLAFAYNVVDKPQHAVSLLDQARILDMVQPEMRSIWDMEALFTWIDANARLGNTERIQGAVEFMRNYNHTKSDNWWGPFYRACREASVGDDEAALDYLGDIKDSPRLPFLYLVRDAGCMRSLRDHPRYEAVLDNIRLRQNELRQQLPATLAEFGVTLD